ncbi:MAG: hypothetical protein ACREL5_12195, partial [Gemmatimonadales bacterium]
RERIGEDEARRAHLRDIHRAAAERLAAANAAADRQGGATRHAVAAAEQARLRLRETRDREAREVAERRALDEEVAVLAARRSAIDALERDHAGLAPAAAALLAARESFGDRIVGPLADFVASEPGDDADAAERLLGDYAHAVLVKDQAAVDAVQHWHAEHHPGALVLLPVEPGPVQRGGAIDSRLRVDPIAADWVAALVGGSEILESSGRVLRRANGAVFLTGPVTADGPIRRRAELKSLASEISKTTSALTEAETRTGGTAAEIRRLEAASDEADAQADQHREVERQTIAAREEAAREVAGNERELAECATQLDRLADRLARAEHRRREVEAILADESGRRTHLDEQLRDARSALATLELGMEQARDARAEWQVREAHVAAQLRNARVNIERIEAIITEAETSGRARVDEIARLDADIATLEQQRTGWQSRMEDERRRLAAVETATGESETALAHAEAALAESEASLAEARRSSESVGEEHHRLQLEVADATAQRQRIVERVESEWKRSFDSLVQAAPPLELDLDSLTTEAERIAIALETIGPVNALAIEEHAEESKRVAFLQGQRDDLVAARQSLLQAIKEIDGTARALFVETFAAVSSNFVRVFQTLFGGGECELRLTDPNEPLESEIEIHAAPRGKRTQRIHLLSSGERTLVAVSLLFSIYLTKPSPFCLMDEVDAPLDDANVGRFLHLLDEFKQQTQFLVITHNPRTMQSADTVYGVTMQELGVSTIVGVRIADHTAAA